VFSFLIGVMELGEFVVDLWGIWCIISTLGDIWCRTL